MTLAEHTSNPVIQAAVCQTRLKVIGNQQAPNWAGYTALAWGLVVDGYLMVDDEGTAIAVLGTLINLN